MNWTEIIKQLLANYLANSMAAFIGSLKDKLEKKRQQLEKRIQNDG
jgi:hypothetical protein